LVLFPPTRGRADRAPKREGTRRAPGRPLPSRDIAPLLRRPLAALCPLPLQLATRSSRASPPCPANRDRRDGACHSMASSAITPHTTSAAPVMASGSGLEMIGLTMIAMAPATALISVAIVVSLARGMFRGSPATPHLLPQAKDQCGSSARYVSRCGMVAQGGLRRLRCMPAMSQLGSRIRTTVERN
jgi:hypothetical protein